MSAINPQPIPPLHIPSSNATVKVSIIDSTSHIQGIRTSFFLSPHIEGHDFLDCPAYSFLIENDAKGEKILFDLGVKKDWWNMAPKILKRLEDGGWRVTVEKHVKEILEEEGIAAGSIGAIVWSHWHWDHTGDPSMFPPTTDLVVGPRFKENFTPGYPAKEDSPILESAYKGRHLREIDFARDGKGLMIGRFQALDFFGDGSFYLLDSPGHAIGHMCGLARTTASTFIFMGGDACHHGGEFRPTQYLPLPSSISPHPLHPTSRHPCPGALYEDIHPKKSRTEPYYEVGVLPDGTGVAFDDAKATATIRKLEEFDGSDDVFVVIAHDDSLLDVVDFFPKSANAWKEKDWARLGRWRFLKDFKAGESKAF